MRNCYRSSAEFLPPLTMKEAGMNVAVETTGAVVVKVAKKHWARWKSDCSGFVSAVTLDLGISLFGNANEMVDKMSLPGSGWINLGHNADMAQAEANLGFVVIGGLKAAHHGHVVVIVPSHGRASAYPYAYWGRLGSVGREDTTINWAWNHHDLPLVQFFARPQASGTH